jgi:hypothetical protein
VTLTRTITAICDHCGHTAATRALTRRAARRWLRARGWRPARHRDACPACTAENTRVGARIAAALDTHHETRNP